MKLPSPPMLVSVAALVVALGGTSYAAAQIGSGQIANNSVTSADVKNKTLTGKDIANGSVKAKDLKPGVVPEGARWLLVNAAGQIEAQSGGFSITAAYPVLPNTAPGGGDNTLRAAGNVYINANEPLDDNGVVASIALQNVVDQNADGIVTGRAAGGNANPEFSGEITATQCQITGVVACGPTAAQNINNFVVSPRNSDGSFTADGTHKRFYVVITGDSSDLVTPAA